MRKILGVAAAIAAAAIVAACGHATAEDPGPQSSRNFQVGSFDRIEVAGPYNVDVRTGPAVSVSAKGPEKMLERLVVEVRGGKLVIGTQRNMSFNWGSQGHVQVAVTVPALIGAQISGSGDLSIDQVKGELFEGGVGGSGNLAVGSLNVEQLKLAIGGSGNVQARQGRAKSVELDIAGSGDIDASGVVAEIASASIAGSGNIAAQATGTAAIDIVGSGDVALSGGAKCTISKAGSGNVSCS